jgi:hypothetical protein
MAGSFVIKSILEFQSNGSRVLGGLAASANDLSAALDRLRVQMKDMPASMAGMNRSIGNMAPKLGAQAGLLNDNAKALERYAAAARAARGAPLVGGGGVGGRGRGSGSGEKEDKGGGGFGVGTAVGLMAGATLFTGVKNAASMQQAINSLSIQLGKTPAQIKAQFLPLAMEINNRTARSVPEELGLIGVLSTFIKDPKKLAKIAPTTALLADTLLLGPQKLDFQQSAAQFGRIAHQLNVYSDRQALQAVADQYYRIATSSPDKANKLVTQLGYFGHSYRGAGVSPRDTMNLLLWGDLAIGSGKYGAGLGRILTDLSNPSTEKYRGQIALGLRDAHGKLLAGGAVDSKGNFSPVQMLQWLAAHERGRTGLQQASDVGQAFNVNAARTIANMTSPQSIAFFKSFSASLDRMPSLKEAQERYIGGPGGQWSRLTSNFGTMSTMLAAPLMPSLTSIAKTLADAESSLAQFFGKHEKIAGAAGLTAIGGGIVATLTVLKGLVSHGGGMVGVGKAFEHLFGAVARLGGGAGSTAIKALAAGRAAVGAAAGIEQFAGALAKLAPLLNNPYLGSIGFGMSADSWQLTPAQRAQMLKEFGTQPMPRSSAAPRSSHHASVVNVASVSITIDGSGDPKATGAAVASALHPMSLLRTAGVNRSTPSLPFAFGMNGVK